MVNSHSVDQELQHCAHTGCRAPLGMSVSIERRVNRIDIRKGAIPLRGGGREPEYQVQVHSVCVCVCVCVCVWGGGGGGGGGRGVKPGFS